VAWKRRRKQGEVGGKVHLAR